MSLREDRFGLMLISSSLLVIAVICGLHLDSQLKARRDQYRAQGLSIVRLLSSIPYAQLVPGRGRQGPLDLVKSSQSKKDFAYAAVVDLDGNTLAEVAALTPFIFYPLGW